MASYIANDSDLILVADAIRSKGKTTESLVFPNEFVNAIAAISTSGTYNLQSKTITPSTSTQTILPDTNYDALSSVTVESIPSAYIIPTGTRSITANGTGIDVAQYAAVDVAVEAELDVPVFTGTYDEETDTTIVTCNKTYAECRSLFDDGNHNAILSYQTGSSSGTVEVQEFIDGYDTTDEVGLLRYCYVQDGVPRQQINYWSNGTITVTSPDSVGTLTVTANGSYSTSYLWNTVNVNVSSSTVLFQSKTVTPTELQQTVIPDNEYDGLSQVTVNAISSNYVGSGIVRDPQLTSETTFDHSIIIEAASGYYSESQSVEISAFQHGDPTGRYSGRDGNFYFTFPIITSGYWDTDESFSISPANITGISVRTGDLTITPTESSQQVATYGDFIDGTITVDAIPSTYIGSSVTTKTAATITPGTTNQTIASGTYLTGTQTIMGDADLTAANIKTGVQIFGVTGSYTSDATASAADIINGKTGYVNGSKITGSLIVQRYYTGTSTPSSSLGSNGDIYVQQ